MHRPIHELAALLVARYRADLGQLGDFCPKLDTHRVIAWTEALRALTLPSCLEPYHDESLGEHLQHLQEELAHLIHNSLGHPCEHFPCEIWRRSQRQAERFLSTLPQLHESLVADVQAAYDGDPAAKDLVEIRLSYPGVLAVAIYRLAHALLTLEVPLIPRIMTEYAHMLTGIDIHPGATIGERFFIDHGTGVVIGETTVIGDDVKLYQGVTLGALSFPKDAQGQVVRHIKRHPTIEDRVTIYAGATVLGGNTVIGHDSVIGGNVWLTDSVPAGSKVTTRAVVEVR